MAIIAHGSRSFCHLPAPPHPPAPFSGITCLQILPISLSHRQRQTGQHNCRRADMADGTVPPVHPSTRFHNTTLVRYHRRLTWRPFLLFSELMVVRDSIEGLLADLVLKRSTNVSRSGTRERDIFDIWLRLNRSSRWLLSWAYGAFAKKERSIFFSIDLSSTNNHSQGRHVYFRRPILSASGRVPVATNHECRAQNLLGTQKPITSG